MVQPGKRLRKCLVVAGLVALLASSPAAVMMPRIYIPVPPPAPIVEVRPVAPGPRHVDRRLPSLGRSRVRLGSRPLGRPSAGQRHLVV